MSKKMYARSVYFDIVGDNEPEMRWVFSVYLNRDNKDDILRMSISCRESGEWKEKNIISEPSFPLPEEVKTHNQVDAFVEECVTQFIDHALKIGKITGDIGYIFDDEWKYPPCDFCDSEKDVHIFRMNGGERKAVCVKCEENGVISHCSDYCGCSLHDTEIPMRQKNQDDYKHCNNFAWVREIGGECKILCDECLEESTAICSVCGHRFLKENMLGDNRCEEHHNG